MIEMDVFKQDLNAVRDMLRDGFKQYEKFLKEK